METIFGRAGSLARVLCSYEARPEQLQLAVAVERALATEEHLVAEAGTGTGKSLAYLVPALESGRRVVVATATKTLQEQLLRNDIPLAAAGLGREPSVAVLKGRQNYLCQRSVHGLGLLGGELLRTARDAQLYELMRPWLESTETGDRAELPFEPPDSLWSELAVGADGCVGRRCAFTRTCFSDAARERARDADLVIANHALYFADLALRAEDDGAHVLPDHDAVVFDEAHRLEETAATWLGGSISLPGIRRLARDVDRACLAAELPVPGRALDRAQRAAETLVAGVAPHTGRRRLRQPPAAPALALADALAALAAALANRNEDLDLLSRRALALAHDVHTCLDAEAAEAVVWVERDRIAWAPVDVSRPLRELLWEGGPTAILVSATLSTGGDASFVRRRLGLRRASELALGSPFDFGEQALVYVPAGLPDPRADGALDAAADEIAALCRISGGRALVLTTSYRALEGLAARLRDSLPYELLVQGEAPRERLVERFREAVESVLLATATFWQGIDVPGEALSLLVIQKLPFAAPDDPLHEARCERVAADGGDWFGDYALPSAVLQLRQGFGRLVRAHSDRGVVAILDPRVRTKGYGRAFLAALPPCRVTSSRADVERFFGAGVALSA